MFQTHVPILKKCEMGHFSMCKTWPYANIHISHIDRNIQLPTLERLPLNTELSNEISVVSSDLCIDTNKSI